MREVPVRYTTTPNLLRIIEAGRLEGFNRTIPEGFEAQLDPEGKHLESFAMPHEHKRGKQVPLHMRVMMLAKVRDTDDPKEIILDMTSDDYHSFEETVVIHNDRG